MCGKVYHALDKKVNKALIKKMSSVLNHRGPDDEGVYIKNNVGLAHKRLSIIDLTSAGHQPMSNEDGSIWIVFNGEIYNFLDLRDELIEKGHCFTSKTDTETIIHLYEEKGVECVHDLRGMFAFAIWDENKKRLLIARDRAGKKPLVYYHNDEGLLFASEIKALLMDPSIKKDVDYNALHHFLTYQYTPSPLTSFAGIKKLPPAHVLIYERGNIVLKRYWNLSYQKKLELPSLKDYGEKFRDVFQEAVRIRLRSDVPLGAFLSGGIDSSLVVAVMSGLMNQPVKTFSIGFEEESYDETKYARIIAEKYKTDHHEFVVKPDAIDILPKLVWHYNEPFADSSAIPTYYVSKMTRDYVTVALNGDGGDESFAGYERYLADKLADYYRFVPNLLRERIIRKAIDLLPYSTNRRSFVRRLKRFVKGISEIPERRYVRWICFFDNEMKNELYTSSFKELTKGIDSVDLTVNWYKKADAEKFIDKTLFVDVMSYLPEDLLVKVDIASMANSLEARSPFLDHKVMEFAASLPADLKLRGIETKYLLKHTLSDIVPKEILHRKKMGFGVPIDVWFRNDLKEMAYDLLLGKRCVERGYFKKESVQRLLDEHVSEQYDHSYRIWALLFMELWHKMFIDESIKPPLDSVPSF
ncbi:MAG: asparagine synthase (glutamine-hydrolyzing) [Deltaproteobacteria bacterium]|nr:asparagine synthase (glutamine-hydrolyzing) [Deltaproteobacteria bacterium]